MNPLPLNSPTTRERTPGSLSTSMVRVCFFDLIIDSRLCCCSLHSGMAGTVIKSYAEAYYGYTRSISVIGLPAGTIG